MQKIQNSPLDSLVILTLSNTYSYELLLAPIKTRFEQIYYEDFGVNYEDFGVNYEDFGVNYEILF